jgi:hypothetical protein
LKRLAILVVCITALAASLAGQSLAIRVDRDQLHIAAPRLRFLAGDALTRLRDGATVQYEFQLTARTERSGRALAHTLEKFAVSYDLWEEKFAITKLGASPRTVTHLSAAAAEAWCLENTSIPVAALSGSQPLWIRLDYQAVTSPKSGDPQENSVFTLTGLIDIFSRRARNDQLRGFEEAGPVRLESLKKK